MPASLKCIYKETLPIGSKVVRRLTETESCDELILIRNQVSEIITLSGFHLTKWFSNHPEFLKSLQKEKLIYSDSVKVLGIHWVPKNDLFTFHLKDLEEEISKLKGYKEKYIIGVFSIIRLFRNTK